MGAEYTRMASLNAANAFSRVDRKAMADAVEKHPPVLWRSCKWAYGVPSDLICGDTILQSSQGVRQGNPFGSLFFSIALGPDTQAIAYLDDIYLFSNDPDVMQRTQAFLADKENIIKLNNNKCKLHSPRYLSTDLRCWGPWSARRRRGKNSWRAR